jgi:plasmid stability protein
VASIVINLTDELRQWLEISAAKRQVSVERGAWQLLEEQRMRDSGATRLDLSIGDEQWTAKMPMRGLLYTDYDTEWTRLPAASRSAHESV